MSQTKENDTSDRSRAPSTNRESTETENQPSERAASDEQDTTAIDKGPFGDLAILTLNGDALLALGINPDRVDEIRYRPYNGALLVTPVTQ